MFRPPVNRAMRSLDRSFFKKELLLSAARIYEPKNIARIRGKLGKSKDMLVQRMILPVRLDPRDSATNRKCILLRPEIRHDDEATWTATVSDLQKSGDIALVPFDLQLDYEYWSAQEILWATIPEELHDDLPHRFSPAGHIAHFNLRERYLPYKNLIASVIIDKNPSIKTVVNKTEFLGEDNKFRVLPFELLGGEPNYEVELREHNTLFHFDFSRVFWNTRLETEHQLLVSKFQPGEAVCDVMAGVGPFAVPAGKKGVFVYANDLNPDCYAGLQKSIALNKVNEFVYPFQADGRAFIRDATASLLADPPVAHTTHRAKRRSSSPPPPPDNPRSRSPKPKPQPQTTTTYAPHTFAHFAMNLPATAIDFLPAFIGLYAGHESLFTPHTTTKLPMVHCYCFGPKVDPEARWGRERVEKEVCARVGEKLGVDLAVGTGEGREVEVRDVRDVAPNKQEICVSFRLPREVAFRRN